jgi:hypothetical protein
MPNNTSSSDLLTPEELKIWRRITDEQYEELLRRGLPFIQTKSGVRHFKNEVDFWFGAVPPGAPKWVTGERISDTIRVWQPSYKELLTPDDALEILLNVHALLDVLFPRTVAKRESSSEGNSE